MKLATRLSLALALVTTTVLGSSFAAVFVLVGRDETRDLDAALRVQALSVERLVGDPEHPRVREGGIVVPESLESAPRFVAVYGPDGALLGATKSFAGRAPAWNELGAGPPGELEPAGLDLVVGGEALRAVLVPLGGRGHVLLFGASRREVLDDERFLRRMLSLLFVLATGLTVLVARWVGARLSREVDEIAGVARRVRGGDLTARTDARALGSAETRALAVDLDEMIESLARAIDAQRTFVSHAAHELRSPLATIRGELELALRRERSADDYRLAIATTLDDVRSLGRLAEDLLTLARIGRVGVGSEVVDVAEVLVVAARAARGGAQARGVSVELELEPALTSRAERRAEVLGDEAQLSRAVRNLLDNAVRCSPEGATVRLSASAEGERVLVAVSDRGKGVAPDERARVFEPFFRGADEQGGDGGAGLGLAIVRSIAEAHGGEVSLDEAWSPGARFVLDLPRAPAAGARR